MVETYECKLCKYKTDILGSYKRHLITKKHLKQEEISSKKTLAKKTPVKKTLAKKTPVKKSPTKKPSIEEDSDDSLSSISSLSPISSNIYSNKFYTNQNYDSDSNDSSSDDFGYNAPICGDLQLSSLREEIGNLILAKDNLRTNKDAILNSLDDVILDYQNFLKIIDEVKQRMDNKEK